MLTSSQIAEWMAYAKVEPFGSLREDYRAGVSAATVANLFGRRKGENPVQPIDFYPDVKPSTGPTPREERDARIASTMALLASMAPREG